MINFLLTFFLAEVMKVPVLLARVTKVFYLSVFIVLVDSLLNYFLREDSSLLLT